jgi:hypothetical protein
MLLLLSERFSISMYFCLFLTLKMEKFMNPMIHFMKTQGLKVALPLLLLTTACGEGTSSSSFQASDAAEPVAELGTPAPASAPIAATLAGSPVAPPAAGDDIELEVEEEAPLPIISPVESTKVPEPTAIAGLALTALGLVAVKRKRVAA